MKVREMIRLLEGDGWVWVRTRRSHRQFRHPSRSGTVTVPGKVGDELTIGLQRSIERQAGRRYGA
jgi:predicted RNA binding protein YcfA (HicA-like mRNA interferase family)